MMGGHDIGSRGGWCSNGQREDGLTGPSGSAGPKRQHESMLRRSADASNSRPWGNNSSEE